MVSSLSRDHFSIVGESSGLRPRPELDGVDVFLFEADNGGLRRAVSLARRPAPRLVAVVREPTEEILLDAVGSGVASVMLRRDVSPAGLGATLRTVVAGHTTLPTDFVHTLLRAASLEPAKPANALTDRELRVLRLLAEGEDTQTIADHLSYSDRTVKNIVHDVLMKLNCKNRTHAVALATRQGII